MICVPPERVSAFATAPRRLQSFGTASEQPDRAGLSVVVSTFRVLAGRSGPPAGWTTSEVLWRRRRRAVSMSPSRNSRRPARSHTGSRPTKTTRVRDGAALAGVSKALASRGRSWAGSPGADSEINPTRAARP